jgi:acetyl esterase/lipase
MGPFVLCIILLLVFIFVNKEPHRKDDRTTTDVILGLVFKLCFPLHKFDQEPNTNTQIFTPSSFLVHMRHRLKMMTSWIKWIILNIWGFHIKMRSKPKQYLLSGSVTVERIHDILSLWEVCSKNQNVSVLGSLGTLHNSNEVEITLTCSSDCIHGDEIEFRKPTTGLFGNFYKTFDTCGLKDFSVFIKRDIPIVVWFHGGGMVLGDSCDEGIFLPYVLFMRSRKNLIWLSVNYRLAPEHPFPSAVIDGLSLLHHLIVKHPTTPIHIGGISAGGNLSAVVGLETFRKYPSVVKSIVSLDPMLDHRMCSKSHSLYKLSPFCPSSFLRYCWTVYLQLFPFQDEKTVAKLRQNSDQNDTNNIQRLISPIVDLPLNLDSKLAPYFLVKTSKNDGLRDEGLELVNSLKHAGARFKAYESVGSHEVSIILDYVVFDSIMKTWCQLLFET